MVHSSRLVIDVDGEHLTCGGFFFGETICFGSLEFIVDCFDSMSFSPKGNNSNAIFVEMARSGSPSLHTILEDSTDEFYTTSSRGGAIGCIMEGELEAI
jgi:hypothetical protein